MEPGNKDSQRKKSDSVTKKTGAHGQFCGTPERAAGPVSNAGDWRFLLKCGVPSQQQCKGLHLHLLRADSVYSPPQGCIHIDASYSLERYPVILRKLERL